MPMHNVITQALGLVGELDVRLFHYELKQNDVYLLCSDGLTDCVSDSQIQQIILGNKNLNDCVDKLITSANDNGGTDNVSLILLRLE